MRSTRIVSMGAAIVCLLPFPRPAWGAAVQAYASEDQELTSENAELPSTASR